MSDYNVQAFDAEIRSTSTDALENRARLTVTVIGDRATIDVAFESPPTAEHIDAVHRIVAKLMNTDPGKLQRPSLANSEQTAKRNRGWLGGGCG